MTPANSSMVTHAASGKPEEWSFVQALFSFPERLR